MTNELIIQKLEELRTLIIAAIPDCRLPAGVFRPKPVIPDLSPTLQEPRGLACMALFHKLVQTPVDNRVKWKWTKPLWFTPAEDRKKAFSQGGRVRDRLVMAVPLSIFRNQLSLRSLFRTERNPAAVAAETIEAVCAAGDLVVMTLGAMLPGRAGNSGHIEVVTTVAEAEYWQRGGSSLVTDAPVAPVPSKRQAADEAGGAGGAVEIEPDGDDEPTTWRIPAAPRRRVVLP